MRRTSFILCIERHYEGLFGEHQESVAKAAIQELAGACRKDKWGHKHDEVAVRSVQVLDNIDYSKIKDLSEVAEIAHAAATVRPKIKVARLQTVVKGVINHCISVAHRRCNAGITAAHASRLLVAAATIRVNDLRLVRDISLYTKYSVPKEELAVTVWAGATVQARVPPEVLFQSLEYHSQLQKKNADVDIRIQRAFLWGVANSFPHQRISGKPKTGTSVMQLATPLATELAKKSLSGNIAIIDLVSTASTCRTLQVDSNLVSQILETIFQKSTTNTFTPAQCSSLVETASNVEYVLPGGFIEQCVRHLKSLPMGQEFLVLLCSFWKYPMKNYAKREFTDHTVQLFRDALAMVLDYPATEIEAVVTGEQYYSLLWAAVEGDIFGPLRQRIIDHLAKVNTPNTLRHKEGKWAPRAVAKFRKRVEDKLCSDIELKMIRDIIQRTYTTHNSFPELNVTVLSNLFRVCVLLASRGQSGDSNLAVCEKVLFAIYLKNRTNPTTPMSGIDFISPSHINDIVNSVEMIQMEDASVIIPHLLSLVSNTLCPDTIVSAVQLGLQHPGVMAVAMQYLSKHEAVLSIPPPVAVELVSLLGSLPKEESSRLVIKALSRVAESEQSEPDSRVKLADSHDVVLFKSMVNMRNPFPRSSKYSQLIIQLRNAGIRKPELYRKAVSFLLSEQPDVIAKMNDQERMLTVHALARAIPKDPPFFMLSLLKSIDSDAVLALLSENPNSFVGKLFMFIDGVSRLSHFRHISTIKGAVCDLIPIYQAVANHSECGILALATLGHISYSFGITIDAVVEKLHQDWDISVLRPSVASKLLNAVSMLRVQNDNMYENIMRHVSDETNGGTLTVTLAAFRKAGKKVSASFIDRVVDVVVRAPAANTSDSVVELMLTFAANSYKDKDRCSQIHSRFVANPRRIANTDLLFLLGAYSRGDTYVSNGVIAQMRKLAAANVRRTK
eukprot:TRINITY_DN15706_c0_g1_i1.p1 TRINITY_DN15706_c0_g1~~TRINITY_DN15706_c0_g1_i1.p1  ORF type:complete len:955 (+),score=117.48 TRINITY_DN15706_c0_g1_i1:65-2929(+)